MASNPTLKQEAAAVLSAMTVAYQSWRLTGGSGIAERLTETEARVLELIERGLAAEQSERDEADALVVASMIGAERANDRVRALQERVRELEARFGHIHVGPGDACASCGLDIRDTVHLRRALAPQPERAP
jgi:hypothetical protein